MKNLKKLLAVLVVISMISTLLVPAFAESSFSYETEAKDLYDLGLYKGMSPTDYVPNLGGKLDRETGVVMLLRLFGQEEDALALTAEDVTAKLAKFSDAEKISDWAKKQVAYAVDKGYVKGLPNGTFAPKADLNGKAYCSLILQQLGYDGEFTYDNAAYDLAEFGGLSDTDAVIFNSNSGINRDSLVGISYQTLQAEYKAGGTVIEKLIELEKVSEALAKEKGVVKAKIKTVAALADVKVQIGKTPELPAKVKVTYEDDTTAELAVTWPAVDTTTVGEKVVEGSIEGYKTSKATVKVIVQPAELLVDSVTASNLKEVVVNFNGEVDADKAGKTASYSVKDNTVSSVTVSDDKKSVTLTLGSALAQQAKVEVTVKKEAGLTADVTKTIESVMDTTLPEAKSIKLTGPKTFEITFSEPVQADSSPDVLINNGVYGVYSKVLSANGRSLTVTLGVSSLNEGTYTVKVSGYKDFANFAIMAKTFDLEYKKDTTAPTATIKQAEQNKVVIEFSKAVYRKDQSAPSDKLTTAYFYHTYSAWQPTNVTTDDYKTYTLTFNTYYLPEGNVTVTVLKSVSDVDVVDAWGNKLEADIKLTTSITVDKEAPKVSKVEASAENKIEVTFSESVTEASAETTANYTIKDKDGKTVTPTISTIDYVDADKKATLTLSDKLSGGNYTVEIKDVVDSSLAANKITTVSVEFTVTDKTPPTVSGATYVDNGSSAHFIYVTFNEAMATTGDGSVLEKYNYRLNNAELPDGSKVEAFGTDNKKVKITVPNGTVVGGRPLHVARVADAAGNKIVAFQTQASASLALEAAPLVTAVSVKDKNIIEIEVDKILTSVPSDGFTVSNGVYTRSLAAVTYTTKDGKTTITATLNADVALAGASSSTAGYTLTAVADKVKSDTGMAMAAGNTGAVFADKYAPSISGDLTAIAGGFRVTFDENVQFTGGNAGLAATEFVIVDKDGKTLKAVTDFTITVSTNVITVDLNGDYNTYTGKLKVSTKDSVSYITDANSNAIKSFSNKEVTLN
ncbi:MAG: Ig-like domain-containing protein [Bacillota bacterium]